MTFLRLVTLHPIFVHFTVGMIPLVVLAYILAAALDSERWTFVADVALYATALLTLATVAFGLISYFTLDWPGGLGPWGGLHLGFGIATAVVLLAFAGYRIGNRKQRPRGGWPAIGGALVIAALVGFTGWIGGEVLVYRSGMAVEAAANGALAPAGSPDLARPPRPDDVGDAMGELRGSWAVLQIERARMVVDRPDAAGFERIGRHAKRIQQLATWLEQRARAQQRAHPAPGGRPSAMLPPSASVGPDPWQARPASNEASHAEQMAKGASALEVNASELVTAAGSRDLIAVSRAIGEVTDSCARCHTDTRWKPGMAHH